MKKSIKSILALVLVAILSTMCVHAEDFQLTSEEEVNEYYKKWDEEISAVSYDDAMGIDYYYRWTIDVQLTDDEKDLYIYELSDNGKVQISFILPKNEWPYDENVIEKEYSALFAIKGKKELVLPMTYGDNSSSVWVADSDGKYKSFCGTFIDVYCDFDKWKTDKDRALGAYIRLRNENVITVNAEEFIKAQDTTMNLPDRYGYMSSSRDKIDEMLSWGAKKIAAKAVTYPDMKKPVVPDEVFMEAGVEGCEKSKPLDISVEEMRKAPVDPFEDIPVVLPPECASHDHDGMVLYGHCEYRGYSYAKTFPEGKLVFNVNVPEEYFSDISSDGNLTVVMQQYQYYSVSRERNATDLNYKRRNINDEFVVTIVGDLGEKKMFTQNGYYNGNYYLEPICYWDEEGRIQYRHEYLPAGARYKHDKAVPYIRVEKTEECAKTGIESIGIMIEDQYYSVPAEEALIDFDAETAMASHHRFAPYLVRYMRADREVNNELENVITDEMIAKFAKYPPKNIGLNGNVEENKEIENKETEKEPETKPENPTDTPTESKDDIKILLDKLILDFSDQNPILEDGRVLVPMRAIFEALGATVEWDEETRTITARKGDTIITLQIGKNEIVKNGETVELDTKAQIMNDRTLVPLRAVSESFDNKVEWNGEEKTVTIVTDET